MSVEMKALIYNAIQAAMCPNRQRPYGLFDYGIYPGDQPPHVIRDFRDPDSDNYGLVVFRSNSRDDAKAEFDRLTADHIGAAAIEAMREPTEEMLEAMDAPFHDELRKQSADSMRKYGKHAYGSAPFSEGMWKAGIDEALK